MIEIGLCPTAPPHRLRREPHTSQPGGRLGREVAIGGQRTAGDLAEQRPDHPAKGAALRREGQLIRVGLLSRKICLEPAGGISEDRQIRPLLCGAGEGSGEILLPLDPKAAEPLPLRREQQPADRGIDPCSGHHRAAPLSRPAPCSRARHCFFPCSCSHFNGCPAPGQPLCPDPSAGSIPGAASHTECLSWRNRPPHPLTPPPAPPPSRAAQTSHAANVQKRAPSPPGRTPFSLPFLPKITPQSHWTRPHTSPRIRRCTPCSCPPASRTR